MTCWHDIFERFLNAPFHDAIGLEVATDKSSIRQSKPAYLFSFARLRSLQDIKIRPLPTYVETYLEVNCAQLGEYANEIGEDLASVPG